MESSRLALAAIGIFILLTPALVTSADKEAEHATDTTALRKKLEGVMPNLKIVDVRPSPIPGLYEVFTGKSMAYTDETGDYLLQGQLIQTSTKKNLTSSRVNERNIIKFDTLPFDKAIKVVKGNGSRQLAIFTDPDCPYCKRLEEELKFVTDVTMYLFLFPLKQIHPQAERRSKAIWCSRDKAQAWIQYVLEKKEPEATCANDPVESNLALAEKLNISGTPTLYFENGTRTAGALAAAELEERLAEADKG